MPGTTTHNFVLYKALKTFGTGSPLFKAVSDSHERACELAATNKYKNYLSDDLCLPAGFAYLGCFGPDLFYLETGTTGTFIADLMHYNKSGPFLIWCLRKVKQSKGAVEAGLRRDLLARFAYYLGHISHIAADISVHPLTNSMVSAYPDNKQAFENAQGWVAKNLWRFHNIVEHYADAYVLFRHFYGDAHFAKDWENVNIARAAAAYCMKKANRRQWFLRSDSRDFYRYTHSYKDGFEEDKYRFFENSNWVINLKEYYTATLPTEKMMDNCRVLVQGGMGAGTVGTATPGLLDTYVDEAVEKTLTFWGEVDDYMNAPQKDYTDAELKEEKQYFPTLRRHWNLDCGIAPIVRPESNSWDVPKKNDTMECVAGDLCFESRYSSTNPDVQ